jgi:hypothetical protein
MEGWRQWRLGRRKRKNERTDLTPTGLLMEGVHALYAFAPSLVQSARNLMNRDADFSSIILLRRGKG